MGRAKWNTLLLLSLAGILILILAAALPNLRLLPGQPFSLDSSQPRTVQPGGIFADTRVLIWMIRGALAFALVCFVIYVIYSLMTPEGRKRLIANVIMLALLFIAADALRNSLPESAEQPDQMPLLPPQMMEMGDANATAVFPADPPEWLTLTVILVISIALFAFAAGIAWFWMRRRAALRSPLEQLAEEAQIAIESLHSGADFRATIIRCYQEMSRVLKAEKGITREQAMTPREFEDQLVSRGFPADSIRTLTRLFEQVRYGSKQADPQEEELAVSCLTDIVDACKAIGR